MNVYLVLVTKKTGKASYVVHSIHTSEQLAEDWRLCKEHDGLDTSLAVVKLDELNEFIFNIEVAKK